MADAFSSLIDSLKRLRMKLKKKFDFTKKKRENGSHFCLEIIALAVRETSSKFDEGLYCRAIYGDMKQKTSKIKKESTPDWKEHLILESSEPSDLIIQVYRKRKSDPLRKFIGQIMITHKQIDDAKDGRIKSWYHLNGRGKSKDVQMGRLFLNLVLPNKAKSNVQQQQQQPQSQTSQPTQPIPFPVRQRRKSSVRFQVPESKPLIARPDVNGVVDRLGELKPGVIVKKEETRMDDFNKKMLTIERVLNSVDSQIKFLESKLLTLQKKGPTQLLIGEIQRTVQDIDESLGIATKRIRDAGTSLNATSDRDLKAKMTHFNKLVDQMTQKVEKFNGVTTSIPRELGIAVK